MILFQRKIFSLNLISAYQLLKYSGIQTGLLCCVFLISCNNNPTQTARKKRVEIKKENGVYRIYKDGTSILIKGAAGHSNLAELVACGGNTISIWDTSKVEKVLNEAQKYNVSVIVGLDIPGGDIPQFYQDEKKVNELFMAHQSTVQRFKNHPSLLAWGLGNELVMPFASNSGPFYKTYNRLLKMMHTEDPDHPVTTTLINLQKGSVLNIKWKIHDLDFISINTYNKLKEIKKEIKKLSLIWNGPYMVSEWSPNGGWESENTVWQAPIENTSTKKAEQYYKFYKDYMPKDDPRFLGSLVFYWGNRQEYTHTWYSIFNEDGIPTEIKEALNDCWKDTLTNHQAVKVKYMLIDNHGARDNILLSPGSKHEASLLLEDDQRTDSLHYSWELLKEDWLYWGRTWNNFKKPAALGGLIADSAVQNTSFICPSKEGAYRIFITVYNSKGFCATANTPFYVVK
jgi:hypothetical protein